MTMNTLQSAYQLIQSDDSRETVAGVVLVAFVAYPVAMQLWRAHRRSGQR